MDSLRKLIGVIIFGLLWFWASGRLDWIQGWALLLTFLTWALALSWSMRRADPDLYRERSHVAENVEPWDKTVMVVYTILLVLLLFAAAFDSGRFELSSVPLWAQALGWLLLCAAGAIVTHVTSVNHYLSRWARLQDDRSQVVISHGMYAIIRHPMYLGNILLFLGLPLVLASWWAYLPSVLIVVVFIYRTAREDSMLQQGLAGYPEYSQRVRYRLIPRIW
jgi:protein-S-isoprenylcysteine O-methyltransferase Ste14